MGRGRLAAFIVGAATIAAATFACRQLVGIGDAPPMGAGSVDSGTADAGPDAPVCGIAYAPASCEACLASSCCSEETACSGSAACSALEGCMGPCAGDPACRARCVQTYRAGNDLKTPAFESCLVRSCATPCGLECGGVAEGANPDAAVACQDCYRSQGCAAATDCISDPACATYAICAVESVTPGSCAYLLDGGIDAASPFTTVGFSYCLDACQLNSNWSCAGHVEWPPVIGGELTIQLRLVDTVLQQPVPGVLAKVCNGADTTCQSPTVMAATDDAGTVQLAQYPEAGPIFSSGAYIDLSEGGILPGVFFWSFPLSQSPVSFQVQTVTPSEVPEVLSAVDAAADPMTGFVVVVGFDCLPSVNGAGMTFTLATPGVSHVFYEQKGVIDPSATETDNSGTALFVNAPVGSNFVNAFAAAAGGPIGRFPIFVRENSVTTVYALPQPN